MKRIAFALALGALSTTAAMAASGDAWYGSSRVIREDPVLIAPAVTFNEPLPADGVTVYYDQPAPVIVERGYVTRPDYVVVEPVRDNDLFVVEPRTYSSVEHGLFNRKGPNDFGQ